MADPNLSFQDLPKSVQRLVFAHLETQNTVDGLASSSKQIQAHLRREGYIAPTLPAEMRQLEDLMTAASLNTTAQAPNSQNNTSPQQQHPVRGPLGAPNFF